MDGRKKTSGVVYREDEADLSETVTHDARPDGQLEPPTIELEARRVLPYAEPVAINDNLDGYSNSTELVPQRRRTSPLRTAAIVLLTPWYIVVAGASVGVIFLFVRGLLAT